MKKIILDTNALMAVAEFKIDIFTALEDLDFKYELFVLDGVIEELRKIIMEQRGKYKRAATLALALIGAKGIGKIKSTGNVDDLLIAYSKKGYLVLTQDKELKLRLEEPYLTIRQKRKVIVVG
jgi:rRNA-processing protein FCF1